jgi:hypothetical protein
MGVSGIGSLDFEAESDSLERQPVRRDVGQFTESDDGIGLRPKARGNRHQSKERDHGFHKLLH